jgi:Protein of unknown function (DUF1194)
MRHWITSFLLLTMQPNVRHGGGMASLGGAKAGGKHAASRRIASLLAVPIAMLVAVAAASIPARAQTAVDLQLVLAVDVSGSVNQTRFELQRDGYVAAFRSARVLETIRSGPHQAIAVTMVQWTGPALQVHVVPWMRIVDAGSAEAFATAVARAPRQLFGGGTSISGAIDYAVTLFSESRFRGTRRVIDVSGDGSNNRGRPVNLARDEAVAAEIGINGLPILALEPDLDDYYERNVIGGPGAFVIAAKDYEAFAGAILKKLITEIAGNGLEPRHRSVRNLKSARIGLVPANK